MVNPIPPGYTPVTPYIVVDGAAAAIEFYAAAFGATEVMRLNVPDTNKIMHAEIQIGGAHIMLTDTNPDMGCLDPKTVGQVTGWICLYVEDTDTAYDQAVKAGATGTMEPADMFWGDRMAGVTDPFGHRWNIMSHTRDVTDEEIAAGFEAEMAGRT